MTGIGPTLGGGTVASEVVGSIAPRPPAAPRPYRLTDLATSGPGLPRAFQGLGTRSVGAFLQRVATVGVEVLTAAAADLLRPQAGRILEIAPGRATSRGGSVALYAHWSPGGRISRMVMRQIAIWRENGFDVVFVSNASPPAEDWEAVAEQTVLRIRRGNTGGDFGAWRDAAREALRTLPQPRELLLSNDSVLGPFRPMEPIVAAWRDGGEGLFGLTESLAGGAHLQSYALLARGEDAVGTVLTHLEGFRDSRSKWRIVQSGEIGLTRRFVASGIRCAALFGYERVLTQVDAATRLSLGDRFAAPDSLRRHPLNPCHHLWRVLVERMAFPYIKTDLISRNPWNLADLDGWTDLVPLREQDLMVEHLRLMCGPDPR